MAAVYRKIHLFDVAVEAGPVDTESARVTAGDRLVTADVDGAIVGLSICYDLRFPELYRALALAGAQILTVPSAFTARTGRDHWEVLLRARAIENAAYVLAPSQIGGPPGQTAYGRSVVIDPWGTVVAQAPDVVGIVRAELDLERVASIRRQIPVLANRRPDAYGSVRTGARPLADLLLGGDAEDKRKRAALPRLSFCPLRALLDELDRDRGLSADDRLVRNDRAGRDVVDEPSLEATEEPAAGCDGDKG